MKPDLDNLINWGELSRLLVGSRSSITRKRVPLRHRAKIAELKRLLRDWINSNTEHSK